MGNERFGFWASLGTSVVTTATFVIALATPPLSGPWCERGCFGYPYLDIAGRFPRDYLWMFPAMISMLLFLAFVIAVAARGAERSRLSGQLAVSLAVMATFSLLMDYFLQVAVIQPSLLANESDGLSLLNQYNPHGLFIALEELGYLLMSLSLLFLVPCLSTKIRLERVVRGLFAGGAALMVAALAGFVFVYGHRREYLFEITAISVDWLVLIPASALMAVVFRRESAFNSSAR